MSYPGPHDRGGLFAFDYLKLLRRAQAVTVLLPTGVLLVEAVALQEHALDYMTPPDFWTTQLMAAVGMTDEDAFRVCRDRCVREGWLVYVRGTYPRAAGRYWVTAPEGLIGLLGRPAFGAALPRVKRGNARGNTPGNTPGNRRGNRRGNARGNTPGNTPGLPLPVPVPVPGGGESARARAGTPTPPDSGSDGKSKNRKNLAKTLRRCGLAANDQAVDEWADLAQGLGGCTAAPAVIACVAWIADTALRRGLAVKYARDAKDLAAEYASKGPG